MSTVPTFDPVSGVRLPMASLDQIAVRSERPVWVYGVLPEPFELKPDEPATFQAINFLGMNLGWVRVPTEDKR